MVNGKPTFVCAFTACFISDIPQQAELAGCLSHRATRPCRECLIPSDKRSDLNYNIVRNGRYYHHIGSVRRAASKLSTAKQKDQLRHLGLSERDKVLNATKIFAPALDPFTTRQTDAAHSENTSLVKHIKNILLDIIIAPKYHPSFL